MAIKANLSWTKLSQPEHEPTGRLLGRLWYGGFIERVLVQEEYSGYPHNGGYHSLSVRLSSQDLDAFADAISEAWPNHEGTSIFTGIIHLKAAELRATTRSKK